MSMDRRELLKIAFALPLVRPLVALGLARVHSPVVTVAMKCSDGSYVYQTVWVTNPFTGKAWKRTDLDNCEFGVRMGANGPEAIVSDCSDLSA